MTRFREGSFVVGFRHGKFRSIDKVDFLIGDVVRIIRADGSSIGYNEEFSMIDYYDQNGSYRMQGGWAYEKIPGRIVGDKFDVDDYLSIFVNPKWYRKLLGEIYDIEPRIRAYINKLKGKIRGNISPT